MFDIFVLKNFCGFCLSVSPNISGNVQPRSSHPGEQFKISPTAKINETMNENGGKNRLSTQVMSFTGMKAKCGHSVLPCVFSSSGMDKPNNSSLSFYGFLPA